MKMQLGGGLKYQKRGGLKFQKEGGEFQGGGGLNFKRAGIIARRADQGPSTRNGQLAHTMVRADHGRPTFVGGFENRPEGSGKPPPEVAGWKIWGGGTWLVGVYSGSLQLIKFLK